MLPIMRSFQLDVARAGAQAVLYARQGDSQCYGLLVTLVERSAPLAILDSYTVHLRGSKPDGTSVLYKGLVQDGRIRAYYGSKAFTADGIMACEIAVFDANGATLYTPRFDVMIEPPAVADDNAESGSEFTALQSALTDMQTGMLALNEALERAEVFRVNGVYETLLELISGVPMPIPGSAYAVGTGIPYTIYVWTGNIDEDGGWLNVGEVHGTPGKDGPYYTPTIDSLGNLTWSNNGELENPAPINIMGPRGYDTSKTVDNVSPDETGNIAIGAVRYNVSMNNLTENEKAQGRANIGAAKVIPATVTLPTSGWSGVGPYTFAATVAAVNAGNIVIAAPAPVSDWAMRPVPPAASNTRRPRRSPSKSCSPAWMPLRMKRSYTGAKWSKWSNPPIAHLL